MAGSSSITLFRSEGATIALQFQARQAAKMLLADLSAGTLRLLLTPYPSQTPILTITPAAVVSGCTLSITIPAEGRAQLVIPLAFWAGLAARRFTLEAFLDTPSGTQRLGEQTIDLTE